MSQIQTNHPWTFLEATAPLGNFSSNDLVVDSDRIPAGFIGVVRDTSIIFTTTGGGVFLEKEAASGKRTRLTQTFTANATGFTFIVQGGDVIRIIIPTTGSGTIDITLFGELIPNTAAKELRNLSEANSLVSDGL